VRRQWGAGRHTARSLIRGVDVAGHLPREAPATFRYWKHKKLRRPVGRVASRTSAAATSSLVDQRPSASRRNRCSEEQGRPPGRRQRHSVTSCACGLHVSLRRLRAQSPLDRVLHRGETLIGLLLSSITGRPVFHRRQIKAGTASCATQQARLFNMAPLPRRMMKMREDRRRDRPASR
jgi:hypothetical protein